MSRTTGWAIVLLCACVLSLLSSCASTSATSDISNSTIASWEPTSSTVKTLVATPATEAAVTQDFKETQQTPTKTTATMPSAKVPGGKIFLGYYVSYDASSWATLEAQADQIDYVAPQWGNIDACGNFSSQDDVDLISFARSRGIGILPSVFTTSGAINHQLLTNESTTAKAIEQMISYVTQEGYEGLDLDLEGVNVDDRPALTAFVARMSNEMHSRGKLLTMAVPAKTSDTTTGWAGAFDYAALAPYVDLFTIMAYSYTTSSSAPGSTAPYDWVNKVADFACKQIPPAKVLLGIAFYGYDWNQTTGGRARGLRYVEANTIADFYGVSINLDPTTRSATFSYTVRKGEPTVTLPTVPAINHKIKTTAFPTCPTSTAATKPGSTPTAIAATPTPVTVQQHVVWLENTASISARLDIARKYNTGGVAAWRLGQEDPEAWPLLHNYRQGTP